MEKFVIHYHICKKCRVISQCERKSSRPTRYHKCHNCGAVCRATDKDNWLQGDLVVYE
jgi:hypothetical protein